jgi:hypothetical protein
MADTFERHQAVVDTYENYQYNNIMPRTGEIIFVTQKNGDDVDMFYQGNASIGGEPLKANAVMIRGEKIDELTPMEHGVLAYESGSFGMVDRHKPSDTIDMGENEIKCGYTKGLLGSNSTRVLGLIDNSSSLYSFCMSTFAATGEGRTEVLLKPMVLTTESVMRQQIHTFLRSPGSVTVTGTNPTNFAITGDNESGESFVLEEGTDYTIAGNDISLTETTRLALTEYNASENYHYGYVTIFYYVKPPWQCCLRLESLGDQPILLNAEKIVAYGDIYDKNNSKILTTRQAAITLSETVSQAQDIEARDTITQILECLRTHGLIET